MEGSLQAGLRVSSRHLTNILASNIPRNLVPGGWTEQLEIGMPILSEDGTLPPNSNPASVVATIEAAGNAAKEGGRSPFLL